MLPAKVSNTVVSLSCCQVALVERKNTVYLWTSLIGLPFKINSNLAMLEPLYKYIFPTSTKHIQTYTKLIPSTYLPADMHVQFRL